ncbi:cellobiose dehydrogenase-like protein [Trichodelitschia bisporula]|uniref:Cellobiose dehydrogenase-like protein n=1 Tax=Trichodelitschia bisporula TaxID=703511 RepID=A0A6G1I1Q0_9PEZI|nr:cellobiose dehydrogenase-like protein [Trichodelitschia bisporula]
MRASLSLLYAAIASVVLAAPWDETWDVIVVGAGPAGLIISNRMSEAGKKTLLLEGGGPSYYSTGGRQRPKWLDGTDLSRVDVPGLYKSIFADQGNLTCTDSAAAFTGCTVGGSSAINAGLFFQPPASDFDNYFPDGWKAKDVKSAIDKCYEKLPSSEVYSQDGKFYLDSGYQAARKWLVDGVGYKEVQFNKQPDEKNGTFGRTVFDYIGGQRGGPTRVYLKEAENRTNFHLEMYTRVQRVERDGNTATGVLVKPVNGSVHTIKLNSGGRVILSGGALQSPQILMFSGIGDKAIQSNLSRAGVLDIKQAWIDNNAVGDGLFDNPNTFVELEGPTIESYVQNYSDPIKADADEYINHRSGPYSFASETSAFWDYVDRNDGTSAGCQGTIDSSGFGDYKSNQTITLNVYGTSGLKSRGKVILNDKLLPGPSPEVYYSDPQDAEDIATFIFRIFQGLDPTLLKPLNLPLNSSQQDIRKYITSETPYTRGEVNHFSSSCRIGSCVDTNTQVKGTTNIHVVDASIVEPLTVNPQFGTMIAAERAAELILKLK